MRSGRILLWSLLTVGASLVVSPAIGQATEVLCGNATDDDGDGLVDCADGDCVFAANVERGCNCYDNLDNDGDGSVDAADANCAATYGLTFVGSGSNCSLVPPGAATPFDLIGPPGESQQNTADTQSKVAIGDVDNDGVPDAIITSKWNNEVRVIATSDNQADGSDAGDVKSDYNLSGKKALFPDIGGCSPNRLLFEHEVLIADIDKDGLGEIFTIVSNRGGNPKTPPLCFYLLGFKYAANDLILMAGYPVGVGTNRPGIFGIADMDGDGKAEIYLRDRLYAAETGKLLASEGAKTNLNTALWDSDVTSAPVAVSVTGDSKMELVCGTKIYTIPNLTNRNPAAPAALTLFRDMNVDFPATRCFVKLMNDPTEYGIDTHSSTSVADLDGDNFIDVIMSGALNSTVGRTAVFYWNVQKNTVSYILTPNSAELGLPPADPNYPSYLDGWIWGPGRVNISDANGDGKYDLSFIAGSQLFCVTLNAAGNLVTLWTQNSVNTPTGPIGYRTINDSRSGVLTVSIYDFDNNGKPEMVYRDSQEVVVIDGETGTIKHWSSICQSHTYTEGVVIADANGDGATDICVTCNTSNSFNINADIQQQALGQVRLYFSNGNEWLPTRQVWNQPGYFVVNINDDLTLPFPQMAQNMIFSNAPCPNGVPGPQRPFNVFLNQVPFLNANGCPVFPAPDLAFDGDDPNFPGVDSNGDGTYAPAITVVPPICGDNTISVLFNIINSGDLPITDNVPVSFFNGDPTLNPPTATLLKSDVIPVVNLGIGQTYTTPPVMFDGPGTPFTLYVVLNNNGAVLPIPNLGPSSTECRIENNIYAVLVTPDPFTATIEKIADNFKCAAGAPNTGHLRAHVFKGATEVVDYSPYAFQWYSGIGTGTPIAAPQGTSFELLGVPGGDYTLVVTNTLKGCSSLPVDTLIVDTVIDPDLTFIINDQTQCSPLNGRLEVTIAGGSLGYTIDWFDNILTPLGITGSVANGLAAGQYLVRVSKSGCSELSPALVVNGPALPDAQAQTLLNVLDCANPNGGSVTADALKGGVIQAPAGFTFDWYFYDNGTGTRGSILPGIHGTGQTRTGLPVGFYQVEIKENATQCIASNAPIVQVGNATVIPTVAITEVTPQTSCDPAQPNGSLLATGSLGGVPQPPGSFTFEWFKGDNTLPANLHSTTSGVNGSQADNVAGGGIFYTVRVTTPQNCTATNKLIITDDINVPLVVLGPTNNGICDPLLAGTPFAGSVTATVTFDGVPVVDFTSYTFSWHDGALLTDPLLPTPSPKNVLVQLDGGFYTLQVERTDLHCVSLPVTTEVLNVPVPPVIVMTETPSTNCPGGAPNGSYSAVVDLGGSTTTVGYGFKWFQGNSITDPQVGAAPVANALQGGQNFTVEVTNNATGCKNTDTKLLQDLSELPVVSLLPSTNTICDPALTSPAVPFNGRIDATITYQGVNVTGNVDYAFTWYNGPNTGSPVNGSSTNEVLNNLDGAFYTATVTNSTLNCTSNPETIEVPEVAVLPNPDVVAVPSTNCDPLLPNGSLDARVDLGGGSFSTAGFGFEWFDGASVLDPQVGAAPLLNSRNGGQNYTVRITNQATGCQGTEVFFLVDDSELPVIVLTPTNNTICDPLLTAPFVNFNGAVSATVTYKGVDVTGAAGYVHTWYDGPNTGSPVNGSSTSQTLNGLDNGFYTGTVTHTALGCTSNPDTKEVLDVPSNPIIDVVPTPSTNCDPGLPNGAILAQVDLGGGTFTTVGYSFEWFQGPSVTDPNIANVSTLTPVNGGQDYTVRVTNLANGCRNTHVETLVDDSELPVLALGTSPNTICDPLLTNPSVPFSGSVTAAITYKGANVTGNPAYLFTWFNGQTVLDPVNGSSTSENLLNLDGGFYTARVFNTVLGCLSDPATDEVLNQPVIPIVRITPTASTNCDPLLPNGSLSADIDLGGGVFTTVGFVFEWFDGDSPSDPSFGPPVPANILSNQNGGNDYTVEVTNLATGCQNNKTESLVDDSELPSVVLAPTDNTICDPARMVPLGGTYDGRVDATVTYKGSNVTGSPDYVFTWHNGPTTGSPVNGSSVIEVLQNLDGAFYTAVVENTVLGCVSDPVSIEVGENLYEPVINVAPVPQTSCVLASPNGVLTATIDETAIGGGAAVNAGYTFTWFSGVGTGGAVVGTTTGTPGQVNQLAGNLNYTIEAVRNLTGCSDTYSEFLQEIITFPVVSLAVLSEQTTCLPFNGSIQATVVPAPSQTYSFFWLAEQPLTVTTDANQVITDVTASPAAPNRLQTNGIGVATDTHAALRFGDYTVVVRDDFTQCISQTKTATIQDETSSTVTFNINAIPSSCVANNGEMAVVAVRDDGTPTVFSFEWFFGGPVNPTVPINFYTNPPQFDPGLNPGGVPFATGTPVSSLTSQIYTVIATDGFGCKTYKPQFLPFLDAHGVNNILSNNTVCVPAPANGAIQILTIAPPGTPGANQTQFTYTVYEGGVPGAIVTNPVISGAPFNWPASTEVCNDGADNDGDGLNNLADPDCTQRVNVTGLDPGLYTVEVIEKISGSLCRVFEVVEIKQDALPPIVDIVGNLTANTACDLNLADGAALVSITQNASDPTVGTTYSLDVTPAPNPPVVYPIGPLPQGNVNITNLRPSSDVPVYTVTVTSSTFCVTNRDISIPNQPAVSEIVSGNLIITPADLCTASGAGEITSIAIVGGAPDNINNFRFDWFDAITVLPGDLAYSAQGNNTAVKGGEILDNTTFATIGPGSGNPGPWSYWVTAFKNLGATGRGCTSAPFKVDIPDAHVDPVITLTPTSNTSCDPAVFEGRIEVDVVDPAPPGIGQNYNYVWISTGVTTPAPGVGNGINNMFGSLQEAQYTLTATNQLTNCDNSRIVTITQEDIPVEVLAATTTPQDICNFDGSVTVTTVSLDGTNPDPLGNYSFRWFEDDPNNAPLAPTAATLNIGNHPTIQAGVFYVKAVRNSPQVFPSTGSGCESPPFRVEILDIHVDPDAAILPSFNTSCNPAVFEGALEVDVTTPSGPGMGAQYAYTWTSTGATTPGPGINQSGISNMFTSLQDAQYTLTARNQITNCTDQVVATILQQNVPVQILTTAKTDQDVCAPDGSVSVTGVALDGAPDGLGSYTFTWFEGDPANPPLAPTVSTLNVGNHPTIGAGSYFVKAVRNSPLAPGSGCESPVQRVDILDVHVDPQATLTPNTNTSCNPAVFEGSIVVDVSDPSGPGVGALYTYAWTSTGVTTPVGAPNNTGVNNLFASLDDAVYTLTATNQITQCVDQDVVTTIDQQDLSVFIVTTTKTDQDICGPDGSITVTQVGRTGSNPDAIGNYTFRWFESDPNTPPLVPTGVTLNVGNHPTIGQNSYYVKAVRNSPLIPGSGCESPPVRVDILDIHVDPVISLTPSVNTSCNPAVFEGAIEVDVSDPGGPGVGALYSYSWVSTGGSTPPPSAGNSGLSNMFTTLDDGLYTLTAQNALTLCTSSDLTTIVSQPIPVSILTVNPIDQAKCYPDGSITVSAVSPNAVGDYTFEWFLGDPNTAPLTDALLATITGPVLQSPQYPTMGAGTYYVQGTKSNLAPGAGCETPPFRVDILNVSSDPLIASSITSNTSCNNAKANAVVVADASEVGGFSGDTYSFAWTLNGGPLLPPAIQTQNDNNTFTVSQTLDGDYSVTVTNVTGTGCTTTRSVVVSIDLSQSFPNLVTVATNDPLDCLPSGDASVTSVSIAGGPPIVGAGLAFPNLSYTWYDDDLSNPIAGQNDFQLSNLLDPGDYLVIVNDPNTDCPSAPTQFTITDNSIVYPVITMSQTAQQVACNAIIGTAALTALADGQPANATYNFDWYNSLDLTGPELYPALNTNVADTLLSGDYSVQVTNNVTACKSSFFYVIRDESPLFTPSMVLTAMPRTLCVGQDGVVLTRITNITVAYPFVPDFTTDMWIGSNPNLANAPDFPAVPNVPGFLINFEQLNLAEGFYTVRVTDNNTGCVSTGVVEVEDDRTPPVVTVLQENPLTNCDPNRANGQLTSSADGGNTFGYTFGWHVGTSVVNPGAPVQTTNKLIAVQAGSYVVRVTNSFTGCFADAPGSVTDATVIPPLPDAEVVRDRTSCIVPNGWVTVSVGGQTIGYTFAWYDGASVKPLSDFDGVDYIDRDIGPYTTTATDIVTGCVSPPATVTVEDARVFPEVTFTIKPSYCLKPSGSVEVIVTTPDVVLDNISWSSPPGGPQVGIGSGIYDVPAAFYEATMTTSEGCVTTEQVEVPTEISSYNGVSANGDGLNDVFEIDCINFFPNNNVKIYNRSGVLVYEANGYDNQGVVFRGVGEMGVYLAGTELPDGTYFYIIDKRDGSKPIAGYLELIR